MLSIKGDKKCNLSSYNLKLMFSSFGKDCPGRPSSREAINQFDSCRRDKVTAGVEH